jgi:hypothetical protein
MDAPGRPAAGRVLDRAIPARGGVPDILDWTGMTLSAPESLSADETQSVIRAARIKRTAPSRAFWVRLCSAVLGGLVAWALVQSIHPVFEQKDAEDQYGFLPADVQWEVDRNNAMLVLAMLGGWAAAGVAVGQGLCGRPWLGTVLAGIACAMLGSAAGVLAGYVGLNVFHAIGSSSEVSDLSRAMLVNGVMFVTLGGGVGLGVGAFFERSLRAVVRSIFAGLLAGVMGGFAYPVLVALLLPSALTNVLIPTEAAERLLWFGIASGMLGLVLPAASGLRAIPANARPMSSTHEHSARESTEQGKY